MLSQPSLPVRLSAMQVCPPSEADRVLDAMTGKGGHEVQKMADVIVVIYIHIYIWEHFVILASYESLWM